MSELSMLCPRCWGSQHEAESPNACALCLGTASIPNQRLSEHFLLSELLHSDTAAAHAIPNDPGPDIVRNLTRLCVELLEPVRAIVGPIHVNSGYRSHNLNGMRNGSKTSAHMEGFAADLFPKAVPRKALFEAIRSLSAPHDQLIWEVTWVHVGLVGPGGVQRRQVEMAFPDAHGVVRYEPFNPNDKRVLA